MTNDAFERQAAIAKGHIKDLNQIQIKIKTLTDLIDDCYTDDCDPDEKKCIFYALSSNVDTLYVVIQSVETFIERLLTQECVGGEEDGK